MLRKTKPAEAYKAEFQKINKTFILKVILIAVWFAIIAAMVWVVK